MPRQVVINGVVVNIMDKKFYDKAIEHGLISENELYSVEGDNVDIDLTYDTEPKQDSPNLLTSGAIYKAFEEAEPEILSNSDIEALLSNFK